MTMPEFTQFQKFKYALCEKKVIFSFLIGCIAGILLLSWTQNKFESSNKNKHAEQIDINAGVLRQTVTSSILDDYFSSPIFGDEIKDEIERNDENIIETATVSSQEFSSEIVVHGKTKYVYVNNCECPVYTGSLEAPILLTEEPKELNIGEAVYSYDKDTLLTRIFPTVFQSNVVITEDKDGWKTYSELWLTNNGERNKLPIDLTASEVKVIPLTPVEPKEIFRWWTPQLAAGFGYTTTTKSGFLSFSPVFFTSSWGKTAIDAKYHFFGLSLDIGYPVVNYVEVTDKELLFGVSFVPVAYRLWDSLMTNSYLSPAIGFSTSGWTGSLRFNLRF